MSTPSKLSLELESAQHLMQWISREYLSPVEKPDISQPSRPGGRPDFVFEDSRRRRFTIEVTRLLSPALRNLENAVAVHVCARVGHLLPGTYALHIPLADPLGRGRINQNSLRQTTREIENILQKGVLGDTNKLTNGLNIWKARDEGNKLVPWITSSELPFDLDDSHPVAAQLRVAFERLVTEAELKFRGYGPNRLLLIVTSQSGLDLEFHAGVFKDGKGILLHWTDTLSQRLANIDAIFLDPGINVRSAGGKVMTGHKYTETSGSHYIELWRRPSIPRLLV